jgi:hypothetical protein
VRGVAEIVGAIEEMMELAGLLELENQSMASGHCIVCICRLFQSAFG